MGSTNLVRQRASENTSGRDEESEVRYTIRHVPGSDEGGADVIEFPIGTPTPAEEATNEDTYLDELAGLFESLTFFAEIGQQNDTELTKSEFVEAFGLEWVQDWVVRYTAEVIGDEAHVVERFERDPETNEPELVLEVHYNIDSFERMVEIDDALLDTYIRSVPAAKRRHVVLAGIPCNAHCPA